MVLVKQNEAKEQKGHFLGMLLGTLGALGLSGNLLTGQSPITYLVED